MDVGGEKCMGNVFANIFCLLNEFRDGREVVESNEFNARILPLVVACISVHEWIIREKPA